MFDVWRAAMKLAVHEESDLLQTDLLTEIEGELTMGGAGVTGSGGSAGGLINGDSGTPEYEL
jgi:hypothetical protein